jgi:hypothetical protein
MNERVFESVRDGLAESVRAGCSIDEAARQHGVNVHTVRSWLARGRKDAEGRYGGFAAAVDAVRGLRRLPARSELGAMSLGELEGLLAEKIRAGSVPAMQLWVRLHPQDQQGQAATDPFSAFDPAPRLKVVS